MEEFEKAFGKEEADSLFAESGFYRFRDANECIYGNCLFGGNTMVGKAVKINHNDFNEEAFLSDLREVIGTDKLIGYQSEAEELKEKYQ